MQKFLSVLLLTTFGLLLSSCGKNSDSPDKDAEKKGIKPTIVTLTKIKRQPLETTEEAVGTLEGLIDATVAAEIPARVVKVYVTAGQHVKKGDLIATLDANDFTSQSNQAQAEIARIQALLDNQSKIVARNQALVDKKFISQNAVDADVSQQKALKEQLEAAKAQANSVSHNKSKTSVFAPVDGAVEKRVVGSGDYVRVGDPIVQIVSKQKLRAHLPFPEAMLSRLKAGQKVRLSTPGSSQTVETVIHELKPMISEGSRSIDVIADIANQNDWQPGGSVTGSVVLGQKEAAIMIPEQALILRPAGEVVYVVRNHMAHQAVVKTGARENGLIEILDGLSPDDTIVVDGAGFLTDKAPVKVSR